MYNKVYVEITNICNMQCSFCHGHHRPPRQMSREEFALVLDKLQGYTQFVYYHLMGEPLTHPLLPDFVRMAGERGFKSIITTNGTLLEKCGEELLRAGLHKVNISLHSFENKDGEGLSWYLESLASFTQNAVKAGAIVVFRLWNKDSDGGKNALALQALRQLLLGEWVENTRGIRIREKIFVEFGERFAWPDLSAEIQGDTFHCYGLKDQFGILADGTVVPCCLDSEGGIALGNIFKEDLYAILHTPRAKAMKDGFRCGKATEALCRRCGYARRFVR
ncbi:MAG: radical SAM protein [Clostridia bacterium]|nr:radical SAM protein [Clostridia bacterium]